MGTVGTSDGARDVYPGQQPKAAEGAERAAEVDPIVLPPTPCRITLEDVTDTGHPLAGLSTLQIPRWLLTCTTGIRLALVK